MGAESQVRGACPLDCPDTCAWVVTVRDGQAVALRGDRDHPYTRGALCAKVHRYLDYTRAPDRLLHPLRRVGAKGEGRFAPISWDEALDEIATRWRDIIARHGAAAIWPYYGSGTMGMVQGVAGGGRRLWNVLGTSQHLMTICTIAGGVGTGYTLGDNRVGMDPETLSASRLILLWGTNTLTTNHHLWKYVEAARRDGAHVVAIDPIRTRTAAAVDEHLALIPGTDAALALGLLHVVVASGREDRAFIDAHTTGWEAFRARILEYPPDRVAAITGLPRARIVALGERLATTRPTGIRLTMGLQRHAGGGMAVRAITCIPGVTGDWRYPGGGAVYDTRGFFRGNWRALWRDDLRPAGTRSLSMTRLGEALLEVDDPPVASMLIYASNPLASVPDQAKARRGLAREDLFTIVVENFPTDTADYADLLLPGTMQTEHADLHYSYGHIYLNWNEPAVAPPGECLPHTEIFRRLAHRLGVTEPCVYDSDDDLARAVLGSEDPALIGITLERLKRDGWARLNVPTPFVPFAEGFPTPSGKLQFVSPRMVEAGLDPVPTYTPPAEAAQDRTELAARYPLALIAPASHYFLNSMFANVPDLERRQGGLRIALHPDDAAARRLADGDRARVHNARGEFCATVHVTDAVRCGVIAASKGYWPKRLSGAANANATVAERDADMGGGAVFHDNRVEVSRA
ncbi:MAG TPA: molybdopterin oxidoreductase family protein [Methylomirabilota bacterium]|jgi:anaerobic selenocysteine-containing dehydrogenase|nr:molybdopterin oxidoreductase family protein [Methylomirabilota bacterium]